MSKLTKKQSTGLAGLISWIAVTAFLLVFLLVFTILATGILAPIFTTVLGGKPPILASSEDGYEEIYKPDYDSKEDSVKAGDELNVKIEEEGAVLLLNEEENGKAALPLAEGSKVSVFGKNSVNLVLGGTGSGGGSGEGAATLFDGLTSGGFKYNTTLKSFYESSKSGEGRTTTTLSDSTSSSPDLTTGETPISSYSSDIIKSFKDYNDAAIVVISRVGGESFDLPRTQYVNGNRVTDKHYLQLDANEYDLLDMVTSRFDKVIVLLNTLTSMQCDFIAEYNNTATDKRIDAVLWIGGPGSTGAEAIGRILNGEVNPSGHTTDLYSADFTKDPTWQNFGDNSQVNNNVSNTAFMENGSNVPGYNMVTYEEGVYLGYRYYETRAYEEKQKNSSSTWYEDNVIFPFGYGLSYTTFDQEIEVTGSLANGGTVTVKVTVTNTGSVAGKDVVQLYVSKPYYKGGIEKPQVELVDFAKTELLTTSGDGKTQTITFTVDAYDLASYDYNDANYNGHKGYEIEAGDYTFYAGRNSHVDGIGGSDVRFAGAYDSATINLAAGTTWTEDPVTGETVENRYTFVNEENTSTYEVTNYDDLQYRLDDVYVTLSDEYAALAGRSEVVRKGMSRTDFDGTFPKALTAADRTLKPDELYDEFLNKSFDEKGKLASKDHNNTEIDAIVAENGMPTTGATGSDLVLHDLLGADNRVAYEGADIDEKWDELLNKITFDEMLNLVNNGAFMTSAIESIGKNLTNDSDGPIGFVNFMPGATAAIFADNTNFATEIVIGSTWNKDLAYQMGLIVGENGLWGDQSGNNNLPYSGWYAPAINLHRSPFSGRNFEYYSEDAILSGKMAVNVINGAAEKGVYTDLKHFALNDQETNRSGVSTFCTEQALRELYLKAFEIAVKGDDNISHVKTASDRGVTEFRGTTGVMSSFNRIGNKWTGGDYRLLTEILRNEWGFRGLVICDYKTEDSHMNSRQMLYAGNDLILVSLANLMWTDASSSSAADVTILRQATKNILYTVANSNSIQIKILGYRMEWWMSLTIALDVIIPVGLAVWGFFAVRGYVKKKKIADEAAKQYEEID